MQLAPDGPAAAPLTWGVVRKLTRHFPYTEMLAVFMPVLAVAWAQGRARPPHGLAQLAPFLFAFAAGFIYNDLTDRRDPSYKRNPLLHGEVAERTVRSLLGVALALSCIGFLALYRSVSALALAAVYLCLCLAYSGLRLRFKETWLGPPVASVIIWTGGPLILALELGVCQWPVAVFLLGAWLIYAGREIHHMVSDYLCDLASGYRTFAVRLGVPRARRVENGLVLAGLLLLMVATALLLGGGPRSLAWHGWGVAGVLLLAGVWQLAGNPADNRRETREGFWLARLAFVLLAVFVLRLDTAAAILAIWAFCTSHRS